MRMQAFLDSLFARLGSAPIGGGKKGEFRDWTKFCFAKLKIWQTTETYSLQTFSVTAAVVALAVVICLRRIPLKVRAITAKIIY